MPREVKKGDRCPLGQDSTEDGGKFVGPLIWRDHEPAQHPPVEFRWAGTQLERVATDRTIVGKVVATSARLRIR